MRFHARSRALAVPAIGYISLEVRFDHLIHGAVTFLLIILGRRTSQTDRPIVWSLINISSELFWRFDFSRAIILSSYQTLNAAGFRLLELRKTTQAALGDELWCGVVVGRHAS